MDEKWTGYGRAGTATYIIAPGRGTRGSRKGKEIVSLAKPCHGQGAKKNVESARENTGPRECPEKRERLV